MNVLNLKNPTNFPNPWVYDMIAQPFDVSLLTLNHNQQRQRRQRQYQFTAVATAELSAIFVPFQRMHPSHPPTQNVNLADSSPTSASHLGG